MKKKKAREVQKNKTRRSDAMKPVCWILIPVLAAALITLDALDVYTFTTERLIVYGILLLVILLPFFSEITVKNLTVKRNRSGSKGDT